CVPSHRDQGEPHARNCDLIPNPLLPMRQSEAKPVPLPKWGRANPIQLWQTCMPAKRRLVEVETGKSPKTAEPHAPPSVADLEALGTISGRFAPVDRHGTVPCIDGKIACIPSNCAEDHSDPGQCPENNAKQAESHEPTLAARAGLPPRAGRGARNHRIED